LPDGFVLSDYDHVRLPDDICRSPDGFVLLTFDHVQPVYGRCRLVYCLCRSGNSQKRPFFEVFQPGRFQKWPQIVKAKPPLPGSE